MQNKSDEKDEEYVSRVNRLINDPQSAVLEQSDNNGSGSSAHTRMPGIDVDFGDGAPPDMMQLLGNSPGKNLYTIILFVNGKERKKQKRKKEDDNLYKYIRH